jgi:hypothetical protein
MSRSAYISVGRSSAGSGSWAPGTGEATSIFDPHFVAGATGFVPKRVNGVNRQGWVTGDMTVSGSARGFVMVRRAP